VQGYIETSGDVIILRINLMGCNLVEGLFLTALLHTVDRDV